MKEVTSQLLAEYNDQHLFDTTLKLYTSRSTQCDDENDVALHYQAIIARLMLDQNIDDLIIRLEKCRDYNSVIKGDLYRDQALALVRKQNQLDKAESLIFRAMEFHHGYPERQAIDLQVHGRLQEARGLPATAYMVLCSALEAHKICPQPRNMAWLASTAFHTLRLAVKTGEQSSRNAHQALRIVTYNDRSWKKRWAARAMYYLPSIGSVRLAERLT